MTTQALQTSSKALRAITIDDNYHDAKCDTDEVYKLRNDAITLCEQALAQPNEPVYWIAECQPHMVELLNWDERTVFLTDKNQLNDYIGTDEEPAGYDITPLYTSPPNTSELEQANKALEGKLEKMRDALDVAKTGLIWYMENTDQANGCDDDAMAQIDEALEECK